MDHGQGESVPLVTDGSSDDRVGTGSVHSLPATDLERARVARRWRKVDGRRRASKDLDALLLGAPIALTREDVDAISGVPNEVSLAVWSAMGFAEIPPGEVAFTEKDVDALRTAVDLPELGVLDVASFRVLPRATGQGTGGPCGSCRPA